MSLQTQLVVDLTAQLISALDLETAKSDLASRTKITLLSGTGADQADLVFSDQRTLGAAANEDLDLAGALVDALGNTVTLVKVKLIVVKAAAGNGGDIVVGNSGVNAFLGPFGAGAHTLAVRPGGLLVLAAPDATAYAVTAGTGDVLKFTNADGGAPATYDLVLIGTSA